jgi:hypothetical protein
LNPSLSQEFNGSTSSCVLIESLSMTVFDQPMLFAEKLWIVLGIGALIGVAVVVWRTQIKKRRMKNRKDRG